MPRHFLCPGFYGRNHHIWYYTSSFESSQYYSLYRNHPHPHQPSQQAQILSSHLLTQSCAEQAPHPPVEIVTSSVPSSMTAKAPTTPSRTAIRPSSIVHCMRNCLFRKLFQPAAIPYQQQRVWRDLHVGVSCHRTPLWRVGRVHHLSEGARWRSLRESPWVHPSRNSSRLCVQIDRQIQDWKARPFAMRGQSTLCDKASWHHEDGWLLWGRQARSHYHQEIHRSWIIREDHW